MRFIVSKTDGYKSDGYAFNVDHIQIIYVTGGAIRVSFAEGGARMTLGEYGTEERAKKALSILVKRMNMPNQSEAIYAPTDEEVDTSMIGHDAKWHHATGKKTKGHGGS